MNLDLVSILTNAGVQRVYENGDEVYGICPNPDHDDHRPSWSMNSTTFAHHCFSCGFSGGLESLLRDLTGEVPDNLREDLMTQSFISRTLEFREERTDEVPAGEDLPVLTEWSLANILRRVPRRMRELRKLTAEALDHYEVRWDVDTRQWVLPIRDRWGTLLGAQYRQKGSVATLPLGIEKSKTLFGLAQAQPYDVAAVTESPLDAVRLWQVGIPAVSTLGAYVSRDQMNLMARMFTGVIMALDDDDAGHKATSILEPGLRRRGCAPIPWNYKGLRDEDGRRVKDVGDVASDDDLISAYHRTIGRGFLC